jgi:hypothetical protein
MRHFGAMTPTSSSRPQIGSQAPAPTVAPRQRDDFSRTCLNRSRTDSRTAGVCASNCFRGARKPSKRRAGGVDRGKRDTNGARRSLAQWYGRRSSESRRLGAEPASATAEHGCRGADRRPGGRPRCHRPARPVPRSARQPGAPGFSSLIRSSFASCSAQDRGRDRPGRQCQVGVQVVQNHGVDPALHTGGAELSREVALVLLALTVLLVLLASSC